MHRGGLRKDLTSGIQDTYPIPVYGILNRRPTDPCYDTDVDLDVIEEGMRSFLGYEKGDARDLALSVLNRLPDRATPSGTHLEEALRSRSDLDERDPGLHQPSWFRVCCDGAFADWDILQSPAFPSRRSTPRC